MTPRTLLPMAAALVCMSVAATYADPANLQRFELANTQITLHQHGFLNDEELATLRLVGQNEEALALFLPEGSGFGALAVAPADGFIRNGMPAASAVALSDLPDMERAKQAAIAECNSLRSGGRACEIVLEIAPR
ncbi:hypothetical protein [Roseinatronobacter alkalisoli]|uniref:DUF4189 domain-containing protein n=1 Tax=Roseinatronobacter alkalisoli TaxID=3028235 RepID=A0ABT5TDE9_9RHOB|nr:hypothetical protein [Roseinatronobacter sp. HJB301]MDD7973153.1 hypothetical protein [Roseinatronobacter sp. HJB301]